MQKVFYIYFILLFLTACRGREVEIPLVFEGERLVLWGKLEAGEPARVQVMKTFPAVGPVPEQNAVNNATVSLYKDGLLYSLLSSLDTNGLYGSDSLIVAGESYVVKVEAPGLTTAESEEVTVPASLPEYTYARQRDAEPERNFAGSPYQDRISLRFTGNIHRTYLTLGFLAYYEEHNWPFNWPAMDNIVANEEDCHTWSSFYELPYGRLFMMNGDCIPVNAPLSFFVVTGNGSRLADGSWGYERARKVTMQLACSTKEWFLYNQMEYKQPEGLDHLVLPPQKVYTNVKNGYGIVYGYHAQEIELH